MDTELRETVDFLASFLVPRQPSPSLSPRRPQPLRPATSALSVFRSSLAARLRKSYEGHWYPDAPLRGSGYRSVQLDGMFLDPRVLAAASDAGLSLRGDEFGDHGMVVWCDPGSVEFRLGDRGYTQCVYDATGRRNCVQFSDGAIVSKRCSSPRSLSPEERPPSVSPTPSSQGSPSSPSKDFADRLARSGVRLGTPTGEEPTRKGKKARRDSGYISVSDMLDVNHSSLSPDITVRC